MKNKIVFLMCLFSVSILFGEVSNKERIKQLEQQIEELKEKQKIENMENELNRLKFNEHGGAAEIQSGKNNIKLFGELNYWSKEDAFERDKKDIPEALNALIGIGYDSASGSIKISNALELRGGIFIPTKKNNLNIGGSLGIISGPNAETELIGRDVVGDGKGTSEDKVSFISGLFEIEKTVPIFRDVYFRFRGGVGFARGRLESEVRYSGTFVSILGLPPSTNYSESWTGLTWELAPSIVIKVDSVNVIFGLAYAKFPKMDETNDLNEFEWSPVGLRFGLEF